MRRARGGLAVVAVLTVWSSQRALAAFTCDPLKSASETTAGNMQEVGLPVCLVTQLESRQKKEQETYVQDVEEKALPAAQKEIATQDLKIVGLKVAADIALAVRGKRSDAEVKAIEDYDQAVALKRQYLEVQATLERILGSAKEAAPCDPKKLASGIPIRSAGKANRDYTTCARAQFASRDVEGKIELAKDIHDKALPAVQAARREAAAPKDPDLSELQVYEEMEGVLYALMEGSDPAGLKLDFFAETRYSSLTKDKDAPFFSKPTPRFTLEVRQLLADPRRRATRTGKGCATEACVWQWNNVETYGFIAFDDSAVEQVTATNTSVTTSGRFIVEGGFVWRPFRLSTQISIGIEAAVGLNGYSKAIPKAPAENDNGLAAQKEDFYKGRYKVGIQLRQEAGDMEGTTTEIAYLRDPMFEERDRWLVRGRIVVKPPAIGGAGIGLYLEGSLEEGSGRDASAVAAGLKLDTLAVLRALLGQK